MTEEINYKHNPLHGMSMKTVLVELVDHYGFDILYAYLIINCFKTNASIASSLKFLKQTDWAREKVESFYLYEFKNLPRATPEQFLLPPRDRIIPEDQVPGLPKTLSLEDAEKLHKKRGLKAAAHGKKPGHRAGPYKGAGPNKAAGPYKSAGPDKASSPYKAASPPRSRKPVEQPVSQGKSEPAAVQDSGTSSPTGTGPWANWRTSNANKGD